MLVDVKIHTVDKPIYNGLLQGVFLYYLFLLVLLSTKTEGFLYLYICKRFWNNIILVKLRWFNLWKTISTCIPYFSEIK